MIWAHCWRKLVDRPLDHRGGAPTLLMTRLRQGFGEAGWTTENDCRAWKLDPLFGEVLALGGVQCLQIEVAALEKK